MLWRPDVVYVPRIDQAAIISNDLDVGWSDSKAVGGSRLSNFIPPTNYAPPRSPCTFSASANGDQSTASTSKNALKVLAMPCHQAGMAIRWRAAGELLSPGGGPRLVGDAKELQPMGYVIALNYRSHQCAAALPCRVRIVDATRPQGPANLNLGLRGRCGFRSGG